MSIRCCRASEQQTRRSIYVHVKRSLLLPILESFDAPETDRASPVRFASTQPTQALGTVNGAFVRQQAAALAGRVKREAGDDAAAQVRRGRVLVWVRVRLEVQGRGRVPEHWLIRRGLSGRTPAGSGGPAPDPRR